MERIHTYLLTFFAPADVQQINRIMVGSPYIVKYWNYLPNVYCFSSTRPINELRAIFDPALNYSNFLIVEINPHYVDGRLPSEEAWTWFRDIYMPVAPPLPPQH